MSRRAPRQVRRRPRSIAWAAVRVVSVGLHGCGLLCGRDWRDRRGPVWRPGAPEPRRHVDADGEVDPPAGGLVGGSGARPVPLVRISHARMLPSPGSGGSRRPAKPTFTTPPGASGPYRRVGSSSSTPRGGGGPLRPAGGSRSAGRHSSPVPGARGAGILAPEGGPARRASAACTKPAFPLPGTPVVTRRRVGPSPAGARSPARTASTAPARSDNDGPAIPGNPSTAVISNRDIRIPGHALPYASATITTPGRSPITVARAARGLRRRGRSPWQWPGPFCSFIGTSPPPLGVRCRWRIWTARPARRWP